MAFHFLSTMLKYIVHFVSINKCWWVNFFFHKWRYLMTHLPFLVRCHFVWLLLGCYLLQSKKKITSYWLEGLVSTTIPPMFNFNVGQHSITGIITFGVILFSTWHLDSCLLHDTILALRFAFYQQLILSLSLHIKQPTYITMRLALNGQPSITLTTCRDSPWHNE